MTIGLLEEKKVACPLCNHSFKRAEGIWSESSTWHCPNCGIQLFCDLDTGEVHSMGFLFLDQESYSKYSELFRQKRVKANTPLQKVTFGRGDFIGIDSKDSRKLIHCSYLLAIFAKDADLFSVNPFLDIAS